MEESFYTYRQIPNYAGYLASSDGQIYSSKNNKFLIQGFTKRGYKEVKLSKDGKPKTHLVHRLIAKAFYGESALSVDHINFIKQDNRIENLRFIDVIENHRMAIENKKIRSGSNHTFATLNKEQVKLIRSSTKSITEIAEEMKLKRHLVYMVKTKRTYKNG